MELQILKEKEMKLLSRKRVSVMVSGEKGTPSRKDMVKAIADKFKVKPGLVILKHMYSQFGENKTKLIVHIYDDAEKMKKFEDEKLIKKHQIEEPKKEDEGSNEPPKKEEAESSE